ncbi:hypothetical protein NA57DRAFT_70987 [Rhizodiscina lignyota]|uniref:MARVEL domain-containing protein n=1 Tax=Rhizodiscina lignyota TaxID=1504668 RepID=A0A9P4INJ6_9PEZI|nr:hypothetical protein NA57DRAFT_70987 [Rhizodiscina lignyota]
MHLARVGSLILRFGEFVCAAVVLGIMAYFLSQYHHTHSGPHGREIYTLVVAVLALILSLIWMIPTLTHMLHYPMDFIISAAWFAAFGILVNYLRGQNCGGVFHWGGIQHGGYCGEWKAAEAFSFISACLWLASFLLGIYIYHKLRNRDSRDSRGNHGAATV